MLRSVLSSRDRLSPLIFVLKLAITVGLFAYLLSRFDLATVLTQLTAIAPLAVAGGEALLLVQLGLLAYRWHLINQIIDAPMGAGQILRLSAIGHFFNQVLPSGFAGDGARAWIAGREGVSIGHAVRAIICDRVVGLLILVLMASVTVAALPQVAVGHIREGVASWLFALFAFGGFAGFFLLGVPFANLLMGFLIGQSLGRLTDDLHRVLFKTGGKSMLITLLAIAVQLLNVAAVLCCALGMRIDLGVTAAIVIVPTVMLVSMAPVSLGGWGVRESAMIVGFGLVGISTADALAVSVAFGLLQVLLGVPGGVLWLARRSHQPERPASDLRSE